MGLRKPLAQSIGGVARELQLTDTCRCVGVRVELDLRVSSQALSAGAVAFCQTGYKKKINYNGLSLFFSQEAHIFV